MNGKEVRVRRIGTLTCGICLLSMGVLYLLKLVGITIGYLQILSLWPVILIGLGLEILTMGIRAESIIYDKGAIFLVIVMAVFAMGMGACEYFMETFADYVMMY